MPHYYDPDKDEYHYGYPGHLDTRYYCVGDYLGPDHKIKRHQLPRGEEDNMPHGSACILTTRIQWLTYPKGCPKLTDDLLWAEEPTGTEYVLGGRHALFFGVLAGTVPPDCTTKAFPIECLGGPRRHNHSGWLVICDENANCGVKFVKKVGEPPALAKDGDETVGEGGTARHYEVLSQSVSRLCP